MVTKEQLLEANYGTEIHCETIKPCRKVVGPKGGVSTYITKVRQSGMVKTWKTMPYRFHMPIKYGLYESHWIDEDNAKYFHFASECPLNKENE